MSTEPVPATPPEPTTVTAELAAMRRIAAVLDGLDDGARYRVVAWAVDRYEPDQFETVDLAAREDVTR